MWNVGVLLSLMILLVMMLYGYIGFHGEMWNVQYCEVDDLSSYDAVLLCMVSQGDIDISLIEHSVM